MAADPGGGDRLIMKCKLLHLVPIFFMSIYYRIRGEASVNAVRSILKSYNTFTNWGIISPCSIQLTGSGHWSNQQESFVTAISDDVIKRLVSGLISVVRGSHKEAYNL